MVAPLAPHVAEELWQRLGTLVPGLRAVPAARSGASRRRYVTLPSGQRKVRFTIDVPAQAPRRDPRRSGPPPGYPHEDVAAWSSSRQDRQRRAELGRADVRGRAAAAVPGVPLTRSSLPPQHGPVSVPGRRFASIFPSPSHPGHARAVLSRRHREPHGAARDRAPSPCPCRLAPRQHGDTKTSP